VTKTQYATPTSLDGFIADERHSLDWLFEVPGGEATGDDFRSFFAAVGAMAMGATTFEWLVAHEGLRDDPGKWRALHGHRPCWVFTHRDLPAIPGAPIRFVEGDVAAVHADMVEVADGRNVWLVGGGGLVGEFADHGLLDEILVSVAPVTLGGGAPLLPRRLTASQLELVDASRRGQFAQLTYRVGGRQP